MPSPSPSTALRRRDLLLLRATPRDRVFELPCQRLYMQFVDARRSRPALASPDRGEGGEPEAVHDAPGPREVFAALARDLAAADVLRIRDREWLADSDLRGEVERLVAGFTARGGRVEWCEAGGPASREY